MTFYDVYIGELGENGALDWGGSHSGNTPKRISPIFPAYGLSIAPYDVAVDWIRSGKAPGGKVDWGAYAASVDVSDLRRFLSTCYGEDVPADLLRFIGGLAPGRYALIACET